MLEAFKDHAANLQALRLANQGATFDYDTTEGNRKARSYVFSLRKAKAAVESTRTAEKAESLRIGRQIDADAKVLMGEIDDLITVHQRRLDEIEQRETDRIAGHVNLLEVAQAMAARVTEHWMGLTPIIIEDIQRQVAMLATRDFAEYATAARVAHDQLQAALVGASERKATYVSEQLDLARLREESAARAKADKEAEATRLREARETQIAAQAAERAVEREREAQIERDRQTQIAIDRESADQKAAAVAAEKRAANARHRAKVHSQMHADLLACLETYTRDGDEPWKDIAAGVVEAIAEGRVRHVTVGY